MQYGAGLAVSYNKVIDEQIDKVLEAQERSKEAYIAPGGLHLRISKQGSALYCQLDDGETVNRHKPAVDVLFNSLLEIGAKHIVATLLTGMGSDGAKGLLALKQQGAYTLAQDEYSSVVWGMPKAAIDMGAANEVVPLEKMTQRLLNQVIKSKT